MLLCSFILGLVQTSILPGLTKSILLNTSNVCFGTKLPLVINLYMFILFSLKNLQPLEALSPRVSKHIFPIVFTTLSNAFFSNSFSSGVRDGLSNNTKEKSGFSVPITIGY